MNSLPIANSKHKHKHTEISILHVIRFGSSLVQLMHIFIFGKTSAQSDFVFDIDSVEHLNLTSMALLYD